MSVDTIVVNVATPKGVYENSFPKTAKVIEVIEAAAKDKGLDQTDKLQLVYKGTVLQPVDRPLVSFGLAGTVNLELVATGSGV